MCGSFTVGRSRPALPGKKHCCQPKLREIKTHGNVGMHLDELWKELEEALTLAGGTVALIEANFDQSNHWTGIQLLALAHQLRGLSTFSDSIYSNDASQQHLIAVYLENSAIFVGAVLAAVSSDCAFLPLDPRWPKEKLLNVLENFRPRCIFYAEKDTGVLGACGAPPLAPSVFNDKTRNPTPCCLLVSITSETIASARKISTKAALDESIAVLKNHQRGSNKTTSSNSIAYVITTSGSTGSVNTGSPPGVCGTALGVYQRCKWMADTYPFQKGDVVAFRTNPCFVDSIWEIFGPLLSGGTAIILAIQFSISVNPYTLVDSLIQYKVTHMTAVPTVWQQMVSACCCYGEETRNQERRQQLKLRQVVSSGEQLPWQLLDDMQGMLLPKECRILNLYGTTEVAADATILECSNLVPILNSKINSAAVPAGLPIKGVVVVLAKIKEEDDDGCEGDVELVHACPGAVGEVLLGGWGVAAGYLGYYDHRSSKINDASLPVTVNVDSHVYLGNKFIQVDTQEGASYCLGSLEKSTMPPSGTAIVAKSKKKEEEGNCCIGTTLFFRSGDVGGIDTQGRLCILGRRDLQIKINGVRVDLSEVEEVIRGHHAVHAVAVKMWPAAAVVIKEEEMKKRVLGVYIELHDRYFVGRLNEGCWHELKDELKSLCASNHVISARAEIDFYFEIMVKLPRSSGGKIDRSALPPPRLAQSESILGVDVPQGRSKRIKTRPLSEAEVHQAFAAALGHNDFEPMNNLFTVLGGTSVTAVTIAEILGIKVEKIFQNPTVRTLAAAASSSSQSLHNKQQRVEGTMTKELRAPSVHIPELRVLWRSKMKGCVDAPPLLLQQQNQHANRNSIDNEHSVVSFPRTERAAVFAASHGGDVSCFDASSGEVIWSTDIPNEQPDPGMVLIDSLRAGNEAPMEEAAGAGAAKVLAVGLNSGKIKYLDSSTGEEVFQESSTGGIDVGGGGMRAAPAVDLLSDKKNLIWAAGHGKKLIVINNQAQIVATLPLPAAVSAGIVVHDSFVCVACLDGTLMAVMAKELKMAATCTRSQQLEFSVLWKHDCGSPILAAPTIINTLNTDYFSPPSSPNLATATAAATQLLVVVVMASGAVMVVDADTGKELWHRMIDPGGYYIPAVYSATMNMILVGSRSGQVTWLGVADGSIQGRYLVIANGGGGAITGLLLLEPDSYLSTDEDIETRDCIGILVSTSDGQVPPKPEFRVPIHQRGDRKVLFSETESD
ncbi:hypothetical protein Ndes2526B_g08567 [Nannochloris sp. 'desiccata']